MTELETELERLIDKHGARVVLCAFSNIAYGKAEHLQNSWQDTRAAKNWSGLGKRLSGVIDWSKQVYNLV